ncbi:hypothetical protein ACFVMC_23680 [Nocardia sp. NPDC127579]|uniref:hypothetical protein n=1 Tax=Nocardia sp. NPDC127579 TaxID=3345402 RepID=UPI00363DE4BB
MESLSWPVEWKRDPKREQRYRELGSAGVHVVWVDYDGVGEQGLLIPGTRPRKRTLLLCAAFGLLASAMAILMSVGVILDGEWELIGGAVLFGLIGFALLVPSVLSLRHVNSKHLPGLRLTPTRVIWASFDGSHLAVHWNDIARVRPFLQSGGNFRQWWNAFSVEVHDPSVVLRNLGPKARRLHRMTNGSAVLTMNDKQLAANPKLAFHLIRHHFETPTARPDIAQALGA